MPRLTFNFCNPLKTVSENRPHLLEPYLSNIRNQVCIIKLHPFLNLIYSVQIRTETLSRSCQIDSLQIKVCDTDSVSDMLYYISPFPSKYRMIFIGHW